MAIFWVKKTIFANFGRSNGNFPEGQVETIYERTVDTENPDTDLTLYYYRYSLHIVQKHPRFYLTLLLNPNHTDKLHPSYIKRPLKN